jgi:hypothetical protein
MSNSVWTTSLALASGTMSLNQVRAAEYGRYGNLAADHMARWMPTLFAAIEDREAYFHALDDRVAETIRDRERSSMPPKSLQEADFPAYVRQAQTAHHLAEEAVLAEMVFLDPEPGVDSDEPETDGDGAFLDPGWLPPRAEETGLSDL